MKSILLTLIFALIAPLVFAQNNDEAYTKTLTQRAVKIVNTLEIKDSSLYNTVVGVLVNQYRNLGEIHDQANNQKKEIKDKKFEKAAQEAVFQSIDDQTNSKLFFQQCSFIGNLATYLNCDQIEKVKDGMTYGVLKVTYDSYIDMIPTLTAEELTQLHIWLVEAREHAICESSSDKKHEWFGKYKGRFNNYLAKRGYNLTKEREEWAKRLKDK